MRGKIWIITVLIVLVLGGWFGIKNMENKYTASESLTSFSNMTLAGLNGLVDLASDSEFDWDNLKSRTQIYTLLVETEKYAWGAERMILLTDGEKSEVGKSLAELASLLRDTYVPVARSIVETKNQVDPKDKEIMNQMVSDLKKAGFPVAQLTESNWDNYNTSLNQFLSSSK